MQIALLDQLAGRRIFIVYALVVRTDGKLDKIPAHPLTTHAIDAQDPLQHMTGATAADYVAALDLVKSPVITKDGPQAVTGYGVGLVISKGCGLAFIDLDHCREPNSGWAPHVAVVEAKFAGAYRETSVSRSGRHIVCSYTGEPPMHGTRCRALNAEAYTAGRFMAVGDIEAEGSPLTDCTAALFEFLTSYFGSQRRVRNCDRFAHEASD